MTAEEDASHTLLTSFHHILRGEEAIESSDSRTGSLGSAVGSAVLMVTTCRKP